MLEEHTVIIEKHDDWYVAYLADMPGVNTQGRTEEEARANLADALSEFLAGQRQLACE